MPSMMDYLVSFVYGPLERQMREKQNEVAKKSLSEISLQDHVDYCRLVEESKKARAHSWFKGDLSKQRVQMCKEVKRLVIMLARHNISPQEEAAIRNKDPRWINGDY